MSTAAQGLARAIGSLLRRTGDHTFHQFFCRDAEAYELVRDAFALRGSDGGALASRPEQGRRPAAAGKAIFGMGRQAVNIHLSVEKGGDEGGTDAKAERQESLQ